MWLLIEDHAERREALAQARVVFSELSVTRPRAISGLAFPEEERARVLEILGLVGLGSPTQTDLEGVFFLEVRPTSSASAATVKVASWDGSNEGGFVKTAQEVLPPALMRNIVFHVPHRDTVPPIEDGQFHIWIWSSPGGTANQPVPETIWGIRVDCRDEGFLPSGQGISIMDPETGWPVGELVGESNLFVHHDLCHKGTDREIQIFRRLCEEVVTELAATPEEKAERQRKLAEAERERSREAYVRECGRRLKKAVDESRRALEEAVENQAVFSQKLADAVRAEANLRRKLEQLAEAQRNDASRFTQEFDRLLAVPGVKRVSVKDGLISVFTEHLVTRPLRDGTIRDLGEFRIEIPTNGSGVRVFNLTRNVNGNFHPHDAGGNRPCLGNIQDGLAKLVGEYEFAVVAQVMLEFLRTINEDDSYGRRVYDWPVAATGQKEGADE